MAGVLALRRIQLGLKRMLDLAVAGLLLLLLAPLMAGTALLVRARLGRPVLFRQERPGQYGRLFCVYKFRTMTGERDKEGKLLPDGERLTPTGRWLRRFSLDELPQLFNVLKGELSLVGPRPLLTKYLELYTPEQARRHGVKPGITGWAQVNGRNALSWEEKFTLDLWYVDHWSLWLDLRILWLTLGQVLRAEGISGEGQATMSEFRGAGNSLNP